MRDLQNAVYLAHTAEKSQETSELLRNQTKPISEILSDDAKNEYLQCVANTTRQGLRLLGENLGDEDFAQLCEKAYGDLIVIECSLRHRISEVSRERYEKARVALDEM